MAPVYADHPFQLIPAQFPAPPAGVKPTAFEDIAAEMACAHNCFLRCLNAVYLQAPHIQATDVVAFSEFAYLFYHMLHMHHRHEEDSLFPGIEKLTGTPGLMAANVDQHSAFHDGFDAYGKYTRACADGKDTFDSARLIAIIDSFAPVLVAHLTDEVTSLLELKTYDSGTFADDYRTMSAATGQTIIKEAGFTTGLVYLIFGVDKSFENGRWSTFPPAPAPILFIVRYIASWVHSSWWKFSPCNTRYQLRPLYAVPKGE